MKKIKICLFMAALLGLAVTARAQNRRIAFDENQSWKGVVEKAKKAGKPIFMDCYTDWCGPCKMLDRDVFSNDRIADYYNAQFVNAKYDMEKGEGVALKDKYGVTAFPTLLFIDPRTEEVIHRVVGAGNVEHMMEQAKVAIDPLNNLQGIKEAFEAGEKTAATVGAYMQALRRAGMSAEQNRVTAEYLQTLSMDQLMQEENWKLFESYVTDPLSAPAQLVFANRGAFSKALGAERANTKLSSTLMIAVNRFRNKESEPVDNFDQARYDALMAFMSKVEDQAAPGCLAQLYAAGYAQQKDYLGLIDVMRNALKYNMIQIGKEQIQPMFLMTNLTKLFGRTDKEVQTKAVALVNDVIDSSADLSHKATFNRIKAMMLKSYGDVKGGEEAEKEAERLRQNGGGPIMMKMG